ncbi:MAG: hypothetical protein IPL33_09555 [Sphingobacteriales bacterium]|nr:hypothetical protein [Sphingobacteriales bacterium]
MCYRSYLLAILWASALLCLLSYCRSDSNPKPIVDLLPYHNLHDTVSYVGMETCRSCHQNIYDTFIQTGMGQSFDHATHAKSAAHFGAHTAVYDSISDFTTALSGATIRCGLPNIVWANKPTRHTIANNI